MTREQYEAGSDLFADQVTTVTTGKLVLNPKVGDEALIPLCPECEEQIRRVEAPNTLVEFQCGCEDLRHFEFPERSEVGKTE